MGVAFPHLFSPLEVRGVEIRNRIFSTGHDTNLTDRGLPGEAMIAYHRARARGGAGLIIVQVAAVHATGFYTETMLNATTDACIEPYRRLAETVHRHGSKIFGQVFHPGRELLHSMDGSDSVAYAPSAVPNERFQIMPRPMSTALIREVVDGFADAASRLVQAGLDGVEVVASHGYLPAQFLNPRVNLRDDEYGGSLENRLRFLFEVSARIREKIGSDPVLGIRISGDDMDHVRLEPEEVVEACAALDGREAFDYYNVIAGSSASIAGSHHIVPPMWIENGYVAPFAALVRERVGKPVFVAGRINQPQIAERVLETGQADMCGMTRAMIADPEMANKASAGRTEDIRACIACNQACVGHMMAGFSISCIQHPETGRELLYDDIAPAETPKRVMVVGGGPGGMKAAAVAAARGHRVALYEQAPRLGGQALLAQLLPERAEFGGIVTNLERELQLAGVEVHKRSEVTRDLVDRESPDVVVLATGARPRIPMLERAEEAHVVDSWQVIRGEANVGSRVVVADWRGDWIGVGVAEKLALDGCQVRLATNGHVAGQRLQQYLRDHANGRLHTLGVQVVPYARLFGVDDDTAYFQHAVAGEPIVCEGVDTVVLSMGHESVVELDLQLSDYAGELHRVGDCLAPRSAEEAVLEGLRVGVEI